MNMNEDSTAAPAPPDEAAEIRHRRIAHAAYLLASARNFAGGDPMQDWLDAERSVDAEGVTGDSTVK